jgi:hypothetical protein
MNNPVLLGPCWCVCVCVCVCVHSMLWQCHSRSVILIPNSPQHFILKHPQPTFLPQCERPTSTPIQINRQNYSSVYLNLYIFR